MFLLSAPSAAFSWPSLIYGQKNFSVVSLPFPKGWQRVEASPIIYCLFFRCLLRISDPLGVHTGPLTDSGRTSRDISNTARRRRKEAMPSDSKKPRRRCQTRALFIRGQARLRLGMFVRWSCKRLGTAVEPHRPRAVISRIHMVRVSDSMTLLPRFPHFRHQFIGS